jgi:RNA polymerase sigma-70 factor (ECF subfamily)
LERAERQAAVRVGFARLNARDQEIIRLMYFDELDAAQTAAVLNCTTNSVYVRLHRALKRLQVVLEEGERDQ